MKTRISCLFGRESYTAGGVVIVCLRIPSDSVSCDSVLLAQANGYITLDPKWVKVADCNSSFFVQTPEIPLDQNVQMPLTNVAHSHCIFITPKEVLPIDQATQDGVFLMFNLPSNLIPSYKGLSGTVFYSISLTLQSHGNNIKQLRFPFTILGYGTNIVPHEIKFSNLVVFGAATVPIENSLLPQFANDSDNENDENQYSHLQNESVSPTSLNGVVYNIRDKDFICALSMKSQQDLLYPGTSITISLQFEGSVQPCSSIRAYLQQCENRINGSRVQDKIIVEACRSSINAQHIHLRLHVPDNLTCSFSCPLFEICYLVVLEFYLGSYDSSPSKSFVEKNNRVDNEMLRKFVNDGNSNQQYCDNLESMTNLDECEPFTWSLPVEIVPHKFHLDIAAEVCSCFDPVSENVQIFS